jgi:hypothetical protein
VADIDRKKLAVAEARHGHEPRLLEGSPHLPSADAEFDIVLRSAVTEHVTGPRDTIAHIRSTTAFEGQSLVRQSKFSEKIRRAGRGYCHTIGPDFVVACHRPYNLRPGSDGSSIITPGFQPADRARHGAMLSRC